MVGPIMRTVMRHVASTVEGAAFELHFSEQELSWRGAEQGSTTRTPSSADGDLSSISTPAMPVLESLPGEDQREEAGEVNSNNWPSPSGFVSPCSDLETNAQDSVAIDADDFFDLNDGFALPPPLLDMEGSAVDDEELVNERGAKVTEATSRAEVESEKLPQYVHEKASNDFGFDAEVTLVLCPREGPRLKDRPSLVAALEHCSGVNSRREQLRRRGAVRVGRRRVACRARPTTHTTQIITATARRCQPWAGAR